VDHVGVGVTSKIYVLYDPIYPDTVFYVGKTINTKLRLSQHISTAKRVYFSRDWQQAPKPLWIKSVLAGGREPRLKVVDRGEDKIENYWIVTLFEGGHPLTNNLYVNNDWRKYYKRELQIVEYLDMQRHIENAINQWYRAKRQKASKNDLVDYRDNINALIEKRAKLEARIFT